MVIVIHFETKVVIEMMGLLPGDLGMVQEMVVGVTLGEIAREGMTGDQIVVQEIEMIAT